MPMSWVDGITEDLITDISKLSGLFVIARSSVFTYKGKAVKVAQVAEDLGVRFVLEGSVRRAGDQVRINAQLIDATTGGHLWAERYDGSLQNMFALQESGLNLQPRTRTWTGKRKRRACWMPREREMTAGYPLNIRIATGDFVFSNPADKARLVEGLRKAGLN